MTSLFRYLLFAAGSLSLTAPLQAQFEIRGGVSNLLDPRRAGASATVAAGGAVNSITVRGGGSGYTVAPNVVVAAPASGITATATAVIGSGMVTSITVSGGTG